MRAWLIRLFGTGFTIGGIHPRINRTAMAMAMEVLEKAGPFWHGKAYGGGGESPDLLRVLGDWLTGFMLGGIRLRAASKVMATAMDMVMEMFEEAGPSRHGND